MQGILAVSPQPQLSLQAFATEYAEVSPGSGIGWAPSAMHAQDSVLVPSRPYSPPPPSLWSDGARRTGATLAVLLVAAIGFGVGYLVFSGGGNETPAGPAPIVVVEGGPTSNSDEQRTSAELIGFPAFATRNTTRVGGVDPTTDAAGVALASYPSLGGVGGPQAAILAPSGSWQAALAATPLTADPIDLPMLLGDPGSTPQITTDALTALRPQGLDKEDGAQVIAVGDVATPDGLQSLQLDQTDPAELTARIDRERARLTGEDDPSHLLVVSSTDAASAMPAAAWAGRSGDPILFADGDEVPKATLEIVKRHPKVPIYLLGPDTVVSAKAVHVLERVGGAKVNRIGEQDPVDNAIAFARYVDGDFGWDVNDPGHGFVLANADRPLDAAIAAPLSAGGKPGPLLLTDDAGTIPEALQGFFSDTEPGYIDDPSRAVYNHTWIMGDASAISVAFQARVDALTGLARVTSETVGPSFGPAAGGGSGSSGTGRPSTPKAGGGGSK